MSNEMAELPHLVEPQTIAKRLGFSPRHITRLAARGIIPGYRIGARWRFNVDEVLRALEAQRGSEKRTQSVSPVANSSSLPATRTDTSYVDKLRARLREQGRL
jgi:excisionase family DNA binding protein